MGGLLSGRVALVTGASKNIGKGMALEVGAAGATVYLTARTLEDTSGALGSLERTAAEINAAGGDAVPVQCDHGDDAAVARVFEQIAQRHGRLDLVVNVASPDFSAMVGRPFWELDLDDMTRCLDIGPRSNYVTTVFAARMMIPERAGVVINISSHGANEYLLSVPYGVGKAAIDKVTPRYGSRAARLRRCRRLSVARVGADRGTAEPGCYRTRRPSHPRWARHLLRGDAAVQREGGGRPRSRPRHHEALWRVIPLQSPGTRVRVHRGRRISSPGSPQSCRPPR